MTEGFTGKERDGTGLDCFGARYYLSAYARWGSVDPLPEQHPGWSPYTYVLDNPLRLVDPDGRQVESRAGQQFEQRVQRMLRGEITPQRYSQQNKAAGVGAIIGLGLAAVVQLAPSLATTGLRHPAATAAGLKEVVDFAFGLVTDAPDPEGLGGGTLGQAAGRLGDDAAGAVVNEGLATLGRAGTGKGVREVIGDARNARALFDQLRGSNPVTEVKPGVFVASGIDGGSVTFRATSKSGPPTVDLHGVVDDVRKIKFVDE